MRSTVLFTFLAIISLSYAIRPLSFINGFNLALGLQDNKKVNKCAYTFLKNDVVELDTLQPGSPYNLDMICLEAAEIYFQTLMNVADTTSTGRSGDLNGLLALTTALDAAKKMQKDQDFEAGDALARALKNAVISVRQSEYVRLQDLHGVVNWTQVAIGFNDQVLVTNEKEFDSCLSDSNQVEVIIKAIIIAINHRDVIHSVEDLVKLIQKLPTVKKDCKATAINYGTFFGKIEEAYRKDQTGFFDKISTNIEKNPVKVTQSMVGFFRGLKSGQDYKAGRSLGVLTQVVLKGIIN